MTLLSLASRQIWPQVLGFLHLSPRPDRLVLFHSDEEVESAGPARRLRELCVSQRLLLEPAIELVRVPHDHFGNIVETFAATAERLGLDESNCRVNFTGGSKLMALAAAEWCRLAGTPCFYLERDFRVIPFLPRGTDLLPQESFQLKEDLLAISEVGGLLGRAICVRRSQLPLQAAEFAQSRKLPVVLKDRLWSDLRSILFPNEPASLDQLRTFAEARTRAST